MKRLPVGTPIFSSYKSFAHYLAVMASNAKSTTWIMNHFLQLYTKHDKNHNVHFLDFNIGAYTLQSHPNNPWLHIESMETQHMVRLGNLKDFFIDCLEGNSYIYVNCDPFYFPHTYSYQNTHRSSQILIFGYDPESQIFHFADYSYTTNNKYEFFSLPMSTIVQAASTIKLDETEHIKVIRLMDADDAFDFDLAAQLLKDHLNSRDTYRLRAYTREGAAFGMEIYRDLDEYLEPSCVERLGLNIVLPYNILWEHKVCLNLLIKYLIDLGRIAKDTDDLLADSTLLCGKSLSVRNALVKLCLSKNYAKIATIRESLQDAQKLERHLIEKLIPYL